MNDILLCAGSATERLLEIYSIFSQKTIIKKKFQATIKQGNEKNKWEKRKYLPVWFYKRIASDLACQILICSADIYKNCSDFPVLMRKA